MSIDIFSPTSSVQLSASATTASVSLDAYSAIIRVYNSGPNVAFCRWGVGGLSATVTDMCVPSGGLEVFDKGAATNFAAITSAANSAQIYITTGKGL